MKHLIKAAAIAVLAGTLAMAGAASLRVPLDVSVGTGRTWDEAAH